MKTIFKKNPENMSLVTVEKEPECDWVFNGEGLAHRKYDGTCCMIDEGIMYKRRTVRKGKKVPYGFIAVDFDENTGKHFGWVPVDFKEDKFHKEAYQKIGYFANGTYELVGPKIQGNVERFDFHRLLKHDLCEIYGDIPTTYDEMKLWFANKDIEGVVFHHPDGRKAKIRKTDFGLRSSFK